MKLASSDRSQRMALAISWAWPTRPMAIVDSMAARTSRSASARSVISVSIMPGRSETARMPSVATSLAKPMVKESTAALLAAAQHQADGVYGKQPGKHGRVEVLHARAAADAGAVHQMGDRAKCLCGCVEQRADIRFACHIGRQGDRLAALGCDVGYDLLRFRL